MCGRLLPQLVKFMRGMRVGSERVSGVFLWIGVQSVLVWFLPRQLHLSALPHLYPRLSVLLQLHRMRVLLDRLLPGPSPPRPVPALRPYSCRMRLLFYPITVLAVFLWLLPQQ